MLTGDTLDSFSGELAEEAVVSVLLLLLVLVVVIVGNSAFVVVGAWVNV